MIDDLHDTTTIKYAIGDTIYWAAWESTETSIECPDCGGTGRLRVTFHDNTEVSIECRNCQRGYDPAIGRVLCWDRKGIARRGIISGINVDGAQVEYRVNATSNSWQEVKEAEAFTNEQDAQDRAAQIAAEESAREREQIMHKEMDARTWAWNASYHRKEIKRAERDLEYHRSKLAVASLKAKKERDAKS